jgi:hypothetical protein
VAAEQPEYRDIREEFFRRYYEKALPYEGYLAAGDLKHAARWREQEKHVALTDAQKALLNSFKRTMHALCVSGVWCGDCVRQGPIFRAFEEASPALHFRYLDRDECPEAMDELRITGARKVPVLVFLTEDFFEVGRYGDRTLSVYRRKAERELGPACPVGFHAPDQEELAVEIQEWLDVVERMHLLARLSPPLRRRYGD